MSSCGSEDVKITESQIDTSTPILNNLDLWLRENFVTPYNIEVKYKWNINDTDVDRFLHPPFENNVMPVANLLTKVWIEPYNTLGGADFIKKIAPREFVVSGGFNYNPGGQSITLGIAEAGARITLFNIDLLQFDSIKYEEDILGQSDDFDVQFSLIGPLSTIHHEYAHILNQNEPYDPAFDLVNPSDYTSSWADRSNEQARSLGYISAYGSSQPGEDFVEMIAYMLNRSRSQWDDLVNNIGFFDQNQFDANGQIGYLLDANGNVIINTQAINFIRQKEQLIVDYYQEKFNINFYELQELTYQALLEI
jgi:substrate import-associated zinc metallohydrolase lipoprotein